MKQKQNYVRFGVVLALFVLVSGIVCPPVSAAVSSTQPDGAFNIVVSPPSIGLEAVPGTSVSTEIKIQNHGIATEHVKVTLMKFGAKGQDGTPDLVQIKSGDEFANWATFSTTHFDAEPNVWKTVKMTISPPATAAFGYYYAVIFSRDGAEKQIQKKQANLLGGVASLVLLDVKAPGAVRRTNIAEFSTAHHSQEFLPVMFNVRMYNSGNVHLATRGNIIVSKHGKQLALIEINLKKGYILPKSYRKFTADWIDGTPRFVPNVVDGKTTHDKQGDVEQNLNWDNFNKSKLRFGKYDAKLVMVYDDGKGDISTEAKLSFWVIPWRIIIGSFVIGLLILAGIWALFLRPLRKRLTKPKGYAQRR